MNNQLPLQQGPHLIDRFQLQVVVVDCSRFEAVECYWGLQHNSDLTSVHQAHDFHVVASRQQNNSSGCSDSRHIHPCSSKCIACFYVHYKYDLAGYKPRRSVQVWPVFIVLNFF